MKRLSIKMRVTLWYTLLMLLLSALVLGFMVFISEHIAQSDAQEALVQGVDANMEEVEYEDGELDIEGDFIYLKNGVSTLVYSQDHQLMGGYLPAGFASDEPFVDGTVRGVQSDGGQFYVYDRLVTFKKHDGVWLRGIVQADGSTGIMGTVLKAAFVLLPFIVLLASLVGYQIARNSFRPVERITRAANAISEGSDLSRRIGLGEGKDELYGLAAAFDHMFSRLEASFEEEKRFTADVSHELRTPTAVILSQCEYALAHASTQEEYRAALEAVNRQAFRMSRLISRLLAFTRLEQGVEKAEFEETDVSELMTMICEEQKSIAGKGIALWQEIEPGLHAAVDRTLITRLLDNLIANAYQYGKEKGNVWVGLRRDNDMLRITVKDDGIGIPAEHLDKIWNRFYQADPARIADEKGSAGLGLAITKQIAKLHGGDATVESTPGEGSLFIITFPIKKRGA